MKKDQLPESKNVSTNEQIIKSNLLTRKQAAELLQINLSTLYHYTKSGKLRSHGLGNRVYYKLDEIMNEALKPLN